MTLTHSAKILLVACVAALTIWALAANPVGLAAGAQAQKAETATQDCAACHEEVVKAFEKNTHAILEKSALVKVENPCESCHGPGKAHIDGGGDVAKIVGFKGTAAKTYSRQCLACHKNNHEITGFAGSTHAKQGLDCGTCHNIHKPAVLTRSLKDRATSLCIGCHTRQKAEFSKPYHHRVMEKAMECTDCHQPHSGIDFRQARLTSAGEEICFRCHTEKQGPFVFEHPAINVRGCQGCHQPHGSNNTKMLVRTTMTSLCLECHATKPVSKSVLTSLPPSFHNLNSPTYRNCTTCHVMIHGSNFDRHFLK